VTPACTIGDVARDAGVSVSTVSHLLNGRTNRMRADTRLRIEASIARLQFRPSRVARLLKTGQTSLIGLLVPSIVNPSYGALARAVDQAARTPHGYRMILGNTHRDPDQENGFLEDLLSHGARGVIVMSSSIADPAFAALVQRGLVAISYDSRRMPGDAGRLDHVAMDNQAAGRMATEHLVARGHERIVFLTAPGATVSRHDKIEGFRQACTAAGIAQASCIMEGIGQSCHGDSELVEMGHGLAARVMQRAVRPTAAVAINDMLAIGFMAGLRERGVSVPGDLSVIGMDDLFLGSLAVPGLTSIQPPVPEMSRVMVDRIMCRLHTPDIPSMAALYPPKLVQRASVGPPAVRR
jgi:DNA-binding LacI/PurR family transcriptional regulator